MATQQTASPATPTVSKTGDRAESLVSRYRAVRRFSEQLCEPLETEDFVIQSMTEASPTRWHLAHTTWFFETFVLTKVVPSYKPFHSDFVYLFNSYYNAVGDQFPRSQRGLLSRPTVEQVFEYRRYVDDRMVEWLEGGGAERSPDVIGVVEIGLSHEQQHQELILTDIKHVFSCNPLHPIYRERAAFSETLPPALRWVGHDGGVRWIGHDGAGCCYDNEKPRHQVYVQPFELASRLVTNGEFLEFMADGGYERPEFWLSDGWAAVQQRGSKAPLYWEERDGLWCYHTLSGFRPVDRAEPVCHVSYFEADAYARWAGAWLPLEAAWEFAAGATTIVGNFVESEAYHPVPCDVSEHAGGLSQMFGDVWEWTMSAYTAYPGYRVAKGALGEYNGKFMCNQMVLRGGSCATSQSHIRKTYRNFFQPDARWQFSGFRLAR